jgi:type IV pilus assembly protein PilW
MELMVSSGISLVMLAVSMSVVTAQRFSYKRNSVDTRLNQNLKGSMELIGSQLREAGENLSGTFPAFEVIDGASGAPDTLIIRRNLLDEVLNVCTTIAGGSSTTAINVAVPGGTAGCVFSDQLHSHTSWNTFRTSKGGTVKAYAYDIVNKVGEFFDLVGVTNNGTTLALTRSAGTWSRVYTAGSASLYLLEEWRFRMSGDQLELIQNGVTASPLKIMYGLENFQIRVKMQDGTTVSTFSNTGGWSDTEFVEVQLNGIDSFQKLARRAEMVAKFMPRNILSN